MWLEKRVFNSWINHELNLRKTAIMRSQLKKGNNYFPCLDFINGPLQPRASVLPMSNTNPSSFTCFKITLVMWTVHWSLVSNTTPKTLMVLFELIFLPFTKIRIGFFPRVGIINVWTKKRVRMAVIWNSLTVAVS